MAAQEQDVMPTGRTGGDSIFKQLNLPQRGEAQSFDDGPKSKRMSEALLLRETLQRRQVGRMSDLSQHTASQMYEDTESESEENCSPNKMANAKVRTLKLKKEDVKKVEITQFRNQLSSRFRSIKGEVRRLASSDNEDN